MSVTLAVIARNAGVDAIAALLNSGFIDIYNTPRPATPDVAISTQTLLARLTFSSTAFGAAVSGTATANSITPDTDAAATGTAAWCRLTKSDHSAVLDGSVGTSGTDLI